MCFLQLVSPVCLASNTSTLSFTCVATNVFLIFFHPWILLKLTLSCLFCVRFFTLNHVLSLPPALPNMYALFQELSCGLLYRTLLLTSSKMLFNVVGVLMRPLSVISLTHCMLELRSIVRLFKLFANWSILLPSLACTLSTLPTL